MGTFDKATNFPKVRRILRNFAAVLGDEPPNYQIISHVNCIEYLASFWQAYPV